jgi:hypothetical protein
MEAQLLEEAISEYQQSLTSITEALEASPDEGELIDVRSHHAGLHECGLTKNSLICRRWRHTS